MFHSVTAPIGANPITIESGKIARLADGAATVRCGETIILVAAVSATSVKEGQDWFPLTVEYREKASAVGKIPGSYFRREGRPSEKEILTCRMTDRPLRPLFPKGYLYDTQIIATLLSADGENDSDILCINGASAALTVSDIPFAGPIGAVRVGRVDGQFVINPTHSQREFSDLDLVYAGTYDDIIMIEGEAKEMPEEAFIEALAFAQPYVRQLVQIQRDLAASIGKEKRVMPLFAVRDEIQEIAYQVAGDRIEAAIYNPTKTARGKAVGALKTEVKEAILAKYPDAAPFEISQAFEYIQKKAFRVSILDKQKRVDGRGYFDIRPLTAEVGLLPRTHGSGLFQRGETQALCIATLASGEEAQNFDAYTGGESSKSFILHYNFPPFSVGETGRTGSTSRREIGHGALAERSIAARAAFAGGFPLRDPRGQRGHGTPTARRAWPACARACSACWTRACRSRQPSAASAWALVTEFEEDGKTLKRHTLLNDIIGSEDHYGDMDFKLCGTTEGVTGFQLDLKLPGIPLSLLSDAIYKAKESRMKVIEVMNATLDKPRTEFEPVRAAHRDGPHQPGQDRAHHRTRRQDDQEHRGRDGCGDQHRGRRQHQHLLEQRRRDEARQGDHPGHDARDRGRRGVQRPRGVVQGVRLLRRGPARQGRAGPHQRTGGLPRQAHGGRGEGRRPDPRQVHRRG